MQQFTCHGHDNHVVSDVDTNQTNWVQCGEQGLMECPRHGTRLETETMPPAKTDTSILKDNRQ